MKFSSSIFFFAACAAGVFVSVPARADIVFANGVSLTSGWYDVNKAYVPCTANIVVDDTGTRYTYSTLVKDAETYYPNSDYMMCWAATASNMLQWRQDQIGADALPAGTPNGRNNSHYADRGQLSIYQTFCENWTDAGGLIETGLAWWLDGSYYYSDYVEFAESGGASLVKADAVSQGGYFKEKITDVSALVGSFNFSGTVTTADIAKNFEYFFENGCVIGLSMSAGTNLGHAITCWGVETDAANGAVTLYYTDSDDCETNLTSGGSSAETDESLKSMSVSVTDGIVNLGYSSTTSWKLSGFAVLSSASGNAPVIPEPSAFGLLAGTCALAFAAARRRRRSRR